ncbi:MAG: hypothetical protein ACOY0T_23460 [Myxococcota bacterium]
MPIAALAVCMLGLAAGTARAEEPAKPAAPKTGAEEPAKPAAPKTGVDSLPGSSRPLGPSLSPEAPPVPATPGGRAPSFGAPTDPDAWAFRFGGKIMAYDTIGFGQKPVNKQEGQTSTPIHVPARIEGRLPFGAGAALTLNLSYGTAIVGGYVTYTVNTLGKEWAGYYNATAGAAANSAYILITPQPLGNLRPQIKVGAFVESFAGTGQWGWGLLGPLLGVRGYGEEIIAEYDVSPDMRLYAAHGLFAVPGVPEFFVRGNYSGWNETGVSTVLQHAHVGFNYKGRYQLKLHAANAAGTDERRVLAPPDPVICNGLNPTCTSAPRDGRIDVYALETHTFLNQWGHFGLAGAYYKLVTANPVHDGIWWTVDWTQGGRETVLKYLGSRSGGTGSYFAVSAQYDFSLANLLWHPEPFDGRGPDVRVALAGIYHKTLTTEDARYRDAQGFQVGLDVEYRMLPWLSATFRSFGTYRNPSFRPSNDPSTNPNNLSVVSDAAPPGRYSSFNVTPGLLFRTDWLAPERIEIAYSRFFYSDFLDANPVLPFDRDVLSVGATLSF